PAYLAGRAVPVRHSGSGGLCGGHRADEPAAVRARGGPRAQAADREGHLGVGGGAGRLVGQPALDVRRKARSADGRCAQPGAGAVRGGEPGRYGDRGGLPGGLALSARPHLAAGGQHLRERGGSGARHRVPLPGLPVLGVHRRRRRRPTTTSAPGGSTEFGSSRFGTALRKIANTGGRRCASSSRPPSAVTRSRASASPSPLPRPAVPWRSTVRGARSSRAPGPSSATSITTPVSDFDSRARTLVVPSPYFSEFSINVANVCASAPGVANTDTSSPA